MNIVAPSGKVFDTHERDLVRRGAQVGFLRYSREEPFLFKSGIESRFYVSGREDLTDNPDFEWSLGSLICDKVTEKYYSETRKHLPSLKRVCLIGIPTAGTAPAQAAAMVEMGRRGNSWLCHRIMREKKKSHGANQTWVNGRPDFAKHFYVAVDNVVTDSKTKIEAAEKLAEDGYDPKNMPWIIIVDLQHGGLKRLEREGFKNIVVLYNLLDLVYVLQKDGVWPAGVVKQVEEEIAAHQLVS